jgi:cytoskeletal protein CcmA (bactofilin family)
MFKKSEEQEWTRFRGALAKGDDAASAPAMTVDSGESVAANPSGTPAQGASSAATAGPSFRTIPGDVNVGLPSTRLSRAADGTDIETLIGEHTQFEGTLRTEGAVRLLGTVDGEIQSSGTIIVEEKAHITARLTAAQVTIAGQVDGQIYCEGRCEIRPTGRVTGEINAGALIVQEGAYFDGSSRMAVPGAAPGAAAGSGAAGSSGSGASSGSAGSSGASGLRSASAAAGSGGSGSGSGGATADGAAARSSA